MRVLIHDFAGHPFQMQLSRELAGAGYEVIHAFPIGLPGPKGALEKRASDPPHLRIRGIQLSAHFRKYSAWRRLLTQRRYAADLWRLCMEERPDVILSSNTPIDIQAEVLFHCRKTSIGFVHWCQDIYCQALKLFLRDKFGGLAQLCALPFERLERAVGIHSDAVIVIAEGFRLFLSQLGVPESRIVVLENWAPLEEIPLMPRENSWNESLGLNGKPVFLYSGTLGLKHRPELIYRLAQELQDECTVLVLTEGIGRDYLERMPRLKNLMLLGFQPYERLPEVLASADVFIATLEADAGQFAVPSKTLSYLCAGRPILLAAPKENLSSSIVCRSGAGIVVDPNNVPGWVQAAKMLAASEEYRIELGSNARQYAEQAFNIQSITSAFQQVLIRACR